MNNLQIINTKIPSWVIMWKKSVVEIRRGCSETPKIRRGWAETPAEKHPI